MGRKHVAGRCFEGLRNASGQTGTRRGSVRTLGGERHPTRRRSANRRGKESAAAGQAVVLRIEPPATSRPPRASIAERLPPARS
jgi:hypothetical protein